MDNFTYENNPRSELETYEWDNVWWEKTGNADKGRIMYIGDSISCGIRGAWNKTDGIEWYYDNCATSKALDNPHLFSLVTGFGHQESYCDAILVNNGLHGWHLSVDEYANYYEKLLCGLKNEFPERRIFVVTTTCVTNSSSRNDTVKARNAAAVSLADKLGIDVIDVYPLSKKLTHTDGVHFDAEGYAALTDKIRTDLKAYLL